MIILITGGVRSGKSKFAESLLKGKEDVVYIATSRMCDLEMEERIKIHKESRPSYWKTVEITYRLKDSVKDENHYLLDCLTNLIANIMYDYTKDIDNFNMEIQKNIENIVVSEVSELIKIIREKRGTLIIVTNEVGFGIVPDNPVGRMFRDIQGKVNQRVAQLCDQVYIVICGIPMRLK